MSATSSNPFASYVENEMRASKARTMEWTKYLSDFSAGWENSKARKIVVGLVQKEQDMCRYTNGLAIKRNATTVHKQLIESVWIFCKNKLH